VVPQILIPFNKREAMTLRKVPKLAGKSEGTVPTWCCQYDIGRRIVGGPWCVSRVALAMLLDGDADALTAYLAGDRHGPLVAPYYERLGLGAGLFNALSERDGADSAVKDVFSLSEGKPV
jgi:hypothetical protein